jgi:hypothetical protein
MAEGKRVVRHALVQGLYAHDVTLVIHVPDGNRVCGIVNPGSPVVRTRFRHSVFDPLIRSGIQPEESSPVQFSRPHLSGIASWNSAVATGGQYSRTLRCLVSSSTMEPPRPPNQALPLRSNPPPCGRHPAGQLKFSEFAGPNIQELDGYIP